MYYADIETDGLLPSLTVLHCAVFKCVNTGVWRKFVRGQEKELEEFLSTAGTLIMHKGITYDKPALNKLGIRCDNRIIDTLLISWYLELNRKQHGLDDYGKQFGIKKPVVKDWKNLSIEDYLHRCTEDVRIQEALYIHQMKQLNELYAGQPEVLERLLAYLELRGRILAAKEKNRWKLDVEGAKTLLAELVELSIQKGEELGAVMPKVPTYKTVEYKRPKEPFKKNGDLKATSMKWKDYTDENGIDFNSTQVYKEKVQTGFKDPQPHYMPEVKEWLFSLGWVPETFEFKRNKETGEVRQIPQVTIKNSGGQICPSIERLAEQVPEVQALVGYSMINHRKGFVNAMLESVDEEGYLYADVQGFTNTLRSKHARPLANIPSVRAPYGKAIRGLLTCEEGEELVGSDMAALEDRWKHHYQWPYDPEYVKTQMAPDYDPHLLICVAAGLLTEEQMNAHKAKSEDHSKVRHIGKGGNYSCQYGAGPPTVARACGVNESVGRQMHTGYWKLNWSIKKIAQSTTVKTCLGTRWQLNPINGFWYHLKADKDRFSTLVQGSGAYSFDMWIGKMFDLCEKAWGKELPLIGDFHDEVILRVKVGHRDVITRMMKKAIELVNSDLNLNRELDIDVQFGKNYAGIH